MDLLLVALLVMAVAAVVAVALGRVRGGLAPLHDPLRPPLPQPLARSSDLDGARFGIALRGYRMDQVDQVLDEARDLLAAKDEEIDRLRNPSPTERTTEHAIPQHTTQQPGEQPVEQPGEDAVRHPPQYPTQHPAEYAVEGDGVAVPDRP